VSQNATTHVEVVQQIDAQLFCRSTIQGFSKKANHNKHEAQICFMIVVVCTGIVPLLIALGAGFWVGKVAPATLSTSAAIATAWLQLRKPQQLWALYRGSQRELEDQETRFKFGIGDYGSAAEPEKLLAERVASIALDAHYQWIPMVPSPDKLRSSSGHDSTVPPENVTRL
jgi:SMODS and SLOG-associating 2TM effector domain 1